MTQLGIIETWHQLLVEIWDLGKLNQLENEIWLFEEYLKSQPVCW